MIPLIALALLAAQPATPPPGAPPPQGGSEEQAVRTEPPGAATTAALAWLAIVDRGDLPASWAATSGVFRTRVPEATWTAELGKSRTPLGAVVSRQPQGEQPAGDLPGAPPGSYRVLGFATDFAQQKGAFETVVMVQDGGVWRVAGYFIADGAGDGAGNGPAGSSPPADPSRR